MKLNTKDRKILYELEEDGFQSLSSIAKKVRLSKQVVSYRINELKKKGILKGINVLIDANKVGYNWYKFFLRYRKVDGKLEEKMVKHFETCPRVGIVVECDGNYDLCVGVWAKNNKEFSRLRKEVFSEYADYIETSALSVATEVYFSKRGYFFKNEISDGNVPGFGLDQNKIQLDKGDRKILRFLDDDARTPLTKIAKKIKLTPTTVKNRIKNMKQNGIIQGTRSLYNNEILGSESYKALITVNKLEEKEVKRFLKYCCRHPNISDIVFMLGNWDIELDIEVKNATAFRKLMLEIRSNFAVLIKYVNTLQVFGTKKYSFFIGD